MAIDPVTSDQSVSSNSIIQEKGSEDRIENVDDSRRDVGFDVKGTKRLLRKMDVRLIPFLALLYLYVSQSPCNSSRAEVTNSSHEQSEFPRS